MQTGVERMCKSIQANREVEMKIGIVSGFCIALLSELFPQQVVPNSACDRHRYEKLLCRCIAPADYMVKRSRIFHSRFACHGSLL
jgi:hypothetical protein